MKKPKHSTKNLFLLTMLFFCFSLKAMAEDPATEPEPIGTTSSNDVPIDGGLSLLLAAGAAYGVKRVRDNRREEK